MNSVKNTIVTLTLLAVGYGAYVVLNNPPDEGMEDLAALESWVQQGPDEMVSADGNSVSAPGSGTAQETALLAEPAPRVADADNVPAARQAELARELPQYGNRPSGKPQPHTHADAPVSDAALVLPGSDPDHSHRPQEPAPADNRATDVGTDRAAEASVTNESASFYTQTQSAGSGSRHSAPAPATVDGTTENPTLPTAAAHASHVAAQGGDPGFEAAWNSIQSSLANDRLADALFALTVWYNEPSLSPEQAKRCIDLLDRLAGAVIYSPDPYLEPPYTVQAGDTLASIAQRYQVPVEFLARVNGIESPGDVQPGETLKVVRGPFRAEVDRQRGELTLFLGRYYAGRFPVRIRPDLPDGPATYEVAIKQPGHEYFDRRTGLRVKADDPANPFGRVWMGLRGEKITAAHNVGIHVDKGLPDIGALGVAEQDAADLMAILSVGSRITVR